MNARAVFFLVSANFLGGSSYAASAYLLKGFTPMAAVFWRMLLAAALFLPALARPRPRLARSEWVRLWGVGFLGYALPLVLGTIGQNLSTSTNASLLIGVEPVAIVLLSAMFLGEGLTPLKVAAILFGLSGSALIVFQGLGFLEMSLSKTARGDALLFVHGFFWALYTIIGKPLLNKMDTLSYTAWSTALSVPWLALAWLTPWPWEARPILTGESVGALIYLAAGTSCLGAWLWNKGLELTQASSLAAFIFIQPLVGVVLGLLLHGDRLTGWSAAGGALILLGVYASTRE